MFGRKNRDAAIPVLVPIIIAIVVVPMMRAVPAVPPIFVRVSIVAVSVVTIVIGPDLFVTRVHVNAKPIVCFGKQSARAPPKPKRKYPFISGFPELDGNEKYFMLLLGTGRVTP